MVGFSPCEILPTELYLHEVVCPGRPTCPGRPHPGSVFQDDLCILAALTLNDSCTCLGPVCARPVIIGVQRCGCLVCDAHAVIAVVGIIVIFLVAYTLQECIQEKYTKKAY